MKTAESEKHSRNELKSVVGEKTAACGGGSWC